MRLAGKGVVVTGGASGIGLETARLMARWSTATPRRWSRRRARVSRR
jgi:NAD(P)-dependent dehydrogenase (short-subunit alcohol dehydrogenase family)